MFRFGNYASVLLLLFAASFASDNESEEYYYHRPSPYILHWGFGSGYCYGGAIGSSLEAGFRYVTLIGGIGSMATNVGWSAGLRVYFSDPDESIRFNLTLLYGPVYIYHYEDASRIFDGVVNGITPTVNIYHNLGKGKMVALLYGIGVWIRGDIKEPDRGPVEALLGEHRFGFTYNIGFNINFENAFSKSKDK